MDLLTVTQYTGRAWSLSSQPPTYLKLSGTQDWRAALALSAANPIPINQQSVWQRLSMAVCMCVK